MRKAKWDANKQFQLVSIYREYECLWNSNSADYHNKDLKSVAESEIVSRMGIKGFDVREMKQKILTIRSAYNRECNKIMKSMEKSCCPVYTPRVKWFEIIDDIVKRTKGLNEGLTFTEEPREQYLEEAVKELKSLNQTILQDKKLNSSENSAFGSFVAASLEKLPVEQALLAQKEIHNILMEHRLNATSSSMESTDQVFHIFLPNTQLG